MDYEPEEKEDQSVMDRIKESPRTVSALIIILIVAAAIYAFSGDQNKQNPANDTLTVATQQASPTTLATSSPTQLPPIMKGSPAVSTAPSTTPTAVPPRQAMIDTPAQTFTPVAAVTAEQLSSQVNALPEGSRTSSSYVEKAQRGDSMTKLARRATTRWLIENSSGYAVTNEHRVYIEDYVRKHMTKHNVVVGQQDEVPFSLVAEAVGSAGQLSNSQLHNLSKYVGHARF